MRLLTDAPDAARALLGPGAELVPAATHDLTDDDRTAWHAFADAPRVWTSRTGLSGVGGPGPLILVGEAPRSHFGRMNDLLASGHDVAPGTVCVARSGARFRGQRGRAWSALAGNLHLVAHLALDVPAAASQPGLAILPAVAAAEAIEALTAGRVRPGLKWVNDLLLGGRKIGGVLTATQLHGDRVRHAVVGIGVNVARAPDLPPAPRALPAGRLADADPVFAAEGGWARLLAATIDELGRGRDAIVAGRGDELVARYRDRAAFLGRHVTIWPVEEEAPGGGPLARGRVLALRPDLSLVLDGVPEPIRSGRMTIIGADDEDGRDPVADRRP